MTTITENDLEQVALSWLSDLGGRPVRAWGFRRLNVSRRPSSWSPRVCIGVPSVALTVGPFGIA